MELIGRVIKEVRPMTIVELESEGWEDTNEIPTVLVLDNGVKLYPSRDTEGNGGGALFGEHNNQHFGLM